ncbi:MAG: outer membrane lipoprotein carrier protein LolA, partial [Hyphomicrobiaceae bacterium]
MNIDSARSVRRAAAAAAMLALLATPVAAQDRKGGESPVGGPGWNTQQQKASADAQSASITLDERQVEIVKKVNDYFNAIENLKGAFLQTTSDNKRLKGKFYMKKPGRVRFEYAPPSRQLIVSDGQQIAIQDLDIDTDDRIMVDQTPFRMLLKKDVDLLRDARILEVH